MQYNIHGDNMPVVVCSLDDGESMICEAGAMSWMTPNMEMETKSGGAGKLFGRIFSGESAFQNYYTARNGSGIIAFASTFPGDILAVEVTPEKPVIIQKRAFLACTAGVQLEVVFQKSWAPRSLAARASSCRSSPAGAPSSLKSTAAPSITV